MKLKTIIFAALLMVFVLLIFFANKTQSTVYGCHEEGLPSHIADLCKKKTYRPSHFMEHGCVMQESQGKWIRTCG